MGTQPDFVSFYRWHVPDPIMFERDLKVTIQQIGAMFFLQGQEAEKEAYDADQPGRRRGLADRRAARRCSPGASASGSTTTRARPTCTARSRRACRRSTWPPPSPTSQRRPYEERDRMEAVAEAVEHGGDDAPPHRHRAGAARARRLRRPRGACSTATEVDAMIASSEELVAGLVAGRHGRRFTVGSYTFEPDALSLVMLKWEGDSDQLHGIEPFAHLSADLEAWGLDPRLGRADGHLVGDDEPELFTEKLNLKRPRIGGPEPAPPGLPLLDRLDARRVPGGDGHHLPRRHHPRQRLPRGGAGQPPGRAPPDPHRRRRLRQPRDGPGGQRPHGSASPSSCRPGRWCSSAPSWPTPPVRTTPTRAAGPCSTATSRPASEHMLEGLRRSLQPSRADRHGCPRRRRHLGSVPKIGDVARAAGVSPATVSRVLNGTGTVAPERAAAVRRAANELGYTPSGPARALRQQTAHGVGRHHRRHREPVLHRDGARDRGRGPQRGAPPRAVQLRRGRRQGGGLPRHRARRADGGRGDRGRLRQGVAPRRAARPRRARRGRRPAAPAHEPTSSTRWWSTTSSARAWPPST